MNTENYEQFGKARPSCTTRLKRIPSHWIPLDLTLGFYVAIQDNGTCVGILRLRVYHYICPAYQVGIVLYPELPAPVYGSVNV